MSLIASEASTFEIAVVDVKIYFMNRETKLNPDQIMTQALLTYDGRCFDDQAIDQSPDDFINDGIPGLSSDSG